MLNRFSGTGLWLAALLLLLGGCAGLGLRSEPPRVTLVGLEPMSVSLFEQKYLIRLRLQNPNPEPLAIRGLSYQLALNGKDFLSGVSAQELVVPAFADRVLETEGVTSLFSYLRQIQALQQGQVESLVYRVSGRISLQDGFYGMPFDYAGELLSLPVGPVAEPAFVPAPAASGGAGLSPPQ